MLPDNQGFSLGAAYGTIHINFDGGGLNQAMSQLNTGMARIGQQAARVGQQMQHVGNTLTTHLTLPLVGIGAAATKLAIDFESAFAGVRKTVDLSEEGFAELESRLLEMATSPEKLTSSLANADVQLARITELAGQLGVSGVDNLAKFTETIGLLGVTTNIAGEEGALALAQFANITNLPIDQIDRLGSVIVDLGNNMATTESDILQMSQRIAGAGNIAGLTQDEIFALGAALSSVGIRAEAGGTAISRILLDINTAVQSGNENLAKFADIAGMSGQEFANAWETDAAAALDRFVQGLQRVESEGGNLAAILDEVGFSDIRVRDSILRLVGSQGTLSEALGIANSAWQTNTALTDEAAKRNVTTESSLNRLLNNLRNVGRELGENMAPALQGFADDMIPVLQNIGTWINQNPELASKLIGVGAALAIVGPLVAVLGTAISAVSGAIVGLIAFALSPLGVALGVGALLVGAYLGNWLGFRDFIDNQVRPALETIWQWVGKVTARIQEFLAVVEKVLSGSPDALSSLQTYLSKPAPGDMQIDFAQRTRDYLTSHGGRERRVAEELGIIGNPITQPGRFLTGDAIGLTGSQSPPIVLNGGITIQANSRAEGEAAAEGFDERMRQLRRNWGS